MKKQKGNTRWPEIHQGIHLKTVLNREGINNLLEEDTKAIMEGSKEALASIRTIQVTHLLVSSRTIKIHFLAVHSEVTHTNQTKVSVRTDSSMKTTTTFL